MAKPTWRKGIPLESSIQERLRRLVREKGEAAAAELLGIGMSSVVRAAAGCGLRRGTVFVIETKLAGMMATATARAA
jgi:hypothetical protein